MNDTTGPLAVPAGTEGGHPHWPAGWAAPDKGAQLAALAAEAATREQEEAARAAREQVIADRLTSGRDGREDSQPAREPAKAPADDGSFAREYLARQPGQ